MEKGKTEEPDRKASRDHFLLPRRCAASSAVYWPCSFDTQRRH